MELDALYNELKSEITAQKLRDITSDIVRAYKSKHLSLLNDYANRSGLDIVANNPSKLFSALIHIFHPDKIIKIHNDLDNFLKNKDIVNLARYKNIYVIKEVEFDLSVDYEEEYDISEDDYYKFGIDLVDENDVYQGNVDEYFYEEESMGEGRAFLDIVYQELSGNTNKPLSILDLNRLTGELDFSGFNIDDLSGVENCTNLSWLDLSFNNLQDIRLLLELRNLEYINLIGNPIEDLSVIEELLDRNVMVVY